jgi:hypothetical protein
VKRAVARDAIEHISRSETMIRTVIAAALLALSSAASAEEAVLFQYPPNENGMLGMPCCCPHEWSRSIEGKSYCEVPVSVAAEWIINEDKRLRGHLAGKALNDAVEAQRQKHANDPIILRGGVIATPMERPAADLDCHTQSAACDRAGHGPGYGHRVGEGVRR